MHRQDRRGQLDALAFHLAQDLADTTQLGGAEEPLPLLLRVLPDVLARVGAVGTEAPNFREVKHFRDHPETPIGLVGDMSEVVVELGDICAGDLGDADLAEGREDKAPKVAPVLIGCAGLDPDRDVLPRTVPRAL